MEDLHQIGPPYDRPPSPPRRQRACLPCSKAKARCNFHDENIGRFCDRVASLEQKIDGIANLLASGQQTSPPPLPPGHHVAYDTGHSSLPTPDSLGHSPQYQLPHRVQSLPQPSPQHYGHHLQEQPRQMPTPPTPGYNLSWEQAEIALNEYKISYMPNFPFVVIEPEVTAQELFHEKPFLFRVVLLVATRMPLEKKRGMKRNVTAYLGQHLLVNEERSLDLLQGLLVFIAWGDLSFYVDRQITHLIHLAMGYAHNLGLTRVPATFMEGRPGVLDAADAEEAMYTRDPRTLQALEKIHNLEEQRTYLGCYYLMSVNSAQFARQNTSASQYVGMCCDCLLQASETSSDYILEKMARLQQCLDRIGEQFPTDKTGFRKSRRFSYLIQDEMGPIRSQLDKLAENMTHVPPHFSTFWLHYHYVLVRLYEPAINLTDPPPNQASFYRPQCLHYCLQAAKSYFTTLLSLPLEGWIYRPFVSSAELLAVIVTVSRLLLLEADGWDLSIARQTLDFPGILQSLVEQFHLATAMQQERNGRGTPVLDETGQPMDKDPFLKCADKVDFIKHWYLSRITGEHSMAPDEFEQRMFPEDWSVSSTSGDNHFWPGSWPHGNWGIEF